MTNYEVERLKNLILSMYVDVYDDFDRYYNKALYDVIGKICDEERPQGEWITQDKGAYYPCECSECHKEPFCNDEGYVLSNFCPNCGAKMTEEAEND